jgi:hypothetical protein
MSNRPAPGEPPRYRSYLLRLWEVENEGQPVWRASLQETHSGERRGFADLAALGAFLAAQTGGSPVADTPPEPSQPEVP